MPAIAPTSNATVSVTGNGKALKSGRTAIRRMTSGVIIMAGIYVSQSGMVIRPNADMTKMDKGSRLPPQRSGCEQTKVVTAKIGDNVSIKITLISDLLLMACNAA